MPLAAAPQIESSPPSRHALVLIDRARLVRLADVFALLCAVALPWSTSAVAILVVLWLAALMPTLNLGDLRRGLMVPAGWLPVLLWILGVAGLAWSDAEPIERLRGLDSFFKLLAIPLLLVQFRLSTNGERIIPAYFMSCLLLLAASYADFIFVGRVHELLGNRTGVQGTPVRDYILQSAEFLLCGFGAAYAAISAWRLRRPAVALALAAAALAFAANIAFVATSRTSLVVMPVLLILFGLRCFSLKGTVAVVAGGIALSTIVVGFSPYLQMRIEPTIPDMRQYIRAHDWQTSTGTRLEMWHSSLAFVQDAPILGHGTGSIEKLFGQSQASGESALVTRNPHQQIIAVAVQLGLVGVAVMVAMWIAHFLLFRGPGLAAWCGTIVVVQTVVSSLFNSYLFDFGSGWTYVWAVGVLGGTLLKKTTIEKAQ